MVCRFVSFFEREREDDDGGRWMGTKRRWPNDVAHKGRWRSEVHKYV